MKYTLKDFYSLDNMYYFPNVQDGIWVDKDEAQQIIDEMNEELEWDNQQAETDAGWEDFGYGV